MNIREKVQKCERWDGRQQIPTGKKTIVLSLEIEM